MEQRVLKINAGGGDIISKPFDFEAMCIIDDKRQAKNGGLRAGMSAVFYLFEGTRATNDVINALSTEEKSRLSQQVNSWYATDLLNAQKNVQRPPKERAQD